MKRHLYLVILLTLLIALSVPQSARADVAPPQNPSGSNPGPGALTNVRMVAETVTLAIQAVDPPTAHVTALFTMRNLGTTDENLAVRFPYSMHDGWSEFKPLRNFGVRINGQPADFQIVTALDESGYPPIRDWAVFDVTFPVGADVELKVSYDLDGNRQNGPDIAFDYILATGAGWNGTIGSADIIAQLPYEANSVNVLIDSSSPNATLAGRELRWHFDELEPTAENNIQVHVLPPLTWKQALNELENINKNPNDSEAWGRLGKAYKEGLYYDKGYPREDAGGLELFRLSRAAYAQAVALKPDDALWHAGYADLLLGYGYWDYLFADPTASDMEIITTGLQELHAAYQLAPNDQTVLYFMDLYASQYSEALYLQADGSYTFLWLTQTPTAAPTATLDVANQSRPTPPAIATNTSTPAPTQAVAFLNTATSAPSVPEPTPAGKVGNPLCGGAALVPMGLLIVVWKRRKN